MSEQISGQEKKSKPLIVEVIKAGSSKTRVGKYERLIKHSEYKKYIRRTTRVMFHDEKDETKIGDKVLVVQSKPFSARKRFNLLKVVEAGRE